MTLLFLTGCVEVKRVNEENTTTEPILNLSPYLDVNTVNLSLGDKLCDLIPPFENTKSPLADRWLCHNLHSWGLYFCEDNVRPESHEICLLSMIEPDLNIGDCDGLRNNILKVRCKEYIQAVEDSIFSEYTWQENNSQFCYYTETGGCKNAACVCPDQYVKTPMSVGFACIPRICELIHSTTAWGEGEVTLEPNEIYCQDAVRTNSFENCNYIQNSHDKDICIAAYIMKTRNLTACQLLNDSKLIEKCMNY